MNSIAWHYQELSLWTGGTKFVYEAARLLAKQYNITLVCNRASEMVVSEFKKAHIKVNVSYRWPGNPVLYYAFFLPGILLDLIRSRELFKKSDRVIVTGFPSNIVGALNKLIFKQKFIYYCYEPYNAFFNYTLKKELGWVKKFQYTLISIAYKWLDIWATKQADCILTLTQTTKNEIQKAYKVPAVFTWVGVDTSLFKPYNPNPIKTKYEDKILIGHSTDYLPVKRTDLAIKSIQLLKRKYPNILLFITSTNTDPKYKKPYIDLAKKLNVYDKILFLDFLSKSELARYYAASKVFISTTYNTTYGAASANLPVKEAMSCETPVIRANVTKEDAEDGISGFLVNPKDTKTVAKKIEFFIKHPEEAKKMGEAGRKKILQHYQWEHVAKLIAQNLENTV